MKKTYINPKMDIFKLNVVHHMLAGSFGVTVGKTPTSANDSDARDFDFDDEE